MVTECRSIKEAHNVLAGIEYMRDKHFSDWFYAHPDDIIAVV